MQAARARTLQAFSCSAMDWPCCAIWHSIFSLVQLDAGAHSSGSSSYPWPHTAARSVGLYTEPLHGGSTAACLLLADRSLC